MKCLIIAAAAGVAAGQPMWTKNGESDKDCAWVGMAPEKRCTVKAASKMLALEGCPDECDGVDLGSGPGWSKNREPWKDCLWVGRMPEKRCMVKSANKMLAMDGCPDQCGGGGTGGMLDVDAEIMKAAKGGTYEECPAESSYFEFMEGVFGGLCVRYAGCVAEHGQYPCPVDTFDSAETKPVYWDGSTCVTTSYTMQNRSFWIIWGYPMDTNELIARTGVNPVMKIPLSSMSYPVMAFDGGGSDVADDPANTLVDAKHFLVYLNAFTEAEVAPQSIIMNKGAENGVGINLAARALAFARTSCQRHMPVLFQAPAYGYDLAAAAQWANNFKGSFFSTGCPDEGAVEDITITQHGWVPGSAYPTSVAWNGNVYAADSTSPNSPWVETMVFPENPSGVFKTPSVPDASRLLCDGVYLFPMYMGAEGWEIPIDKRPTCSSWSFSVTKVYSARARVGFSMYDKANYPAHGAAIEDITNSLSSLAYGDYSEFLWSAQSQIIHYMMAKPYTDPTSWIGAYTSIQKEKWAAVTSGFEGCPYLEITNPNSGAYAWIKFGNEYAVHHEGMGEPSFFAMTMGIRATLYSWGFRGADPADYYGPGTTTNSFTRMHLYRDVHVYEEVARRAFIVCSGGAVDGYMSADEWVAASEARRRRRLGGVEALDTTTTEARIAAHKDTIREAVPRLDNDAVDFHATWLAHSEMSHQAIEEHCAPLYTTSCLTAHSETEFFGKQDKFLL